MFKTKLTRSALLEATNWTTGSGEPEAAHLAEGNIIKLDNNGEDERQAGLLPSIYNDEMLPFSLRIRGCREKARLDKKLLARSGFSRNLEIYCLAPFKDMRL